MSKPFEEIFGPIIGNGAQATVYAKGDCAVKLYRKGYPKTNVFSEAFIMANLERLNFPSPKIREVLLVNGRYGLRMDRVRGKILSEELADPARCEAAVEKLVEIQCRLQAYDASTWAPDLKRRFRDDLIRNDHLFADLRKELLGILDGLPDGRALCHCDFHPGNIFFDGEDYTIIDLLQISSGDPAADAACSYVSYCMIHPDLAELYLNKYCARSGISRASVSQWLRMYAGTLLGQVPEQLTPIIERFLRTNPS